MGAVYLDAVKAKVNATELIVPPAEVDERLRRLGWTNRTTPSAKASPAIA